MEECSSASPVVPWVSGPLLACDSTELDIRFKGAEGAGTRARTRVIIIIVLVSGSKVKGSEPSASPLTFEPDN